MNFYAFLSNAYHKYFERDRVALLKKRGLVVGENFSMLDDVKIDFSHCWHITIGNDVTLAPRVHILAHDASTKIPMNCTRIGKVTIGDRVFIGASTIILPGVAIGNDVIIGAGSVVTRDIPDNSVAAGNPAKVLTSTDLFISRRKKEKESLPYFGEEYTVEANISEEMKKEMIRQMKGRFAYIF